MNKITRSLQRITSRYWWSQRVYRLAERIHGREQTFIRVGTPHLRMLVAESRWQPTVSNVQVLGDDVSFHGNIPVRHLDDSDFNPDGGCVEIVGIPNRMSFQSIEVGAVRRAR